MILPRNNAQALRIMPPNFEPDYVEGAVLPQLLTTITIGERPSLPMIDLPLSKENAIPPQIFGMLYDGWAPNGQADGLSVFLQGYNQRGPHNERKRIYYSAQTPDLYPVAYAPKVARFLDRLFAPDNSGKPLMQQFFANYFDLYWDLHLGVSGDAVPPEVRQIGQSFMTVIGFWYPTLNVVHENYMRVRALREPLKQWIDARVQDLIDGRIPDGDKTMVHYWLQNGGQGENFRRKDIVFECFHNFLAFSQWGNMTFNIIKRLEPTNGDAAVQTWFEQTMASDPDAADGSTFTPLDRFVMELFRTISPNGGSYSTAQARTSALGSAFSGVITEHLTTSENPEHWQYPNAFDPDRYKTAPTSADNGEAAAQAAGLARCPFALTSFAVKDGRQAAIANSGYGAVYGIADGTAHPVCDTAGYAPFGFGYRRCAGENLTVAFFKDLLRAIHRNGIEFVALDIEQPRLLPAGPITIVEDRFAFQKKTA